MNILRLTIACCVAALLFCGRSCAMDLLTDGAFEYATAIPEWSLVESIYDQTTMMPRDFGNINSAQQQTFGPQSGDLALWLRAFAGGQTPGPNTLTSASLSQVRPAIPGEEYTFSGWSRWELRYSGGVTTLNATGPLGAVASPTLTTMQLAFLDGSGQVVGTPVVRDLRTEQNNFNFWREHVLAGTAPAGAVSVRVSADATAMLWNGGGNESAFYDNFSLTKTSDPMTQLLGNPDIEDTPGFFHPSWVVTEVPGGNIPNDPTISTADFADRPASGGQLGAWLRSFTGNTAQPADGTISQTVPGLPGGDYTFTGWSRFETNYSGGVPSFNTQTLMELAFLDGSGMPIETHPLDLYDDGQRNGAGWRQHSIRRVAPAGTSHVRVSGSGLDMEVNPAGGQQSAFFDDFSLTVVTPGVDGDFNNDGNYDCLDIDSLVAAIAGGTNPAAFDLNGDTLVNLADRNEWLTEAGGVVLGPGLSYLLGDADLSGEVDGSDFGQWNAHKNTNLAAWCSGDFTANGVIDRADFDVWNTNKFTSSAAAAVPEPTTAGWLLALSTTLGLMSNFRGTRQLTKADRDVSRGAW